MNKIKLDLNANKKQKKAIFLKKILEDPEEFFSTILIGNNFVNIAAASISTILFTKFITSNEELILIFSTLTTTIIILIFAEIIPKSYAFRYSDKISYLYAYPIKFFNYIFFPLVKITTFISNFLFRKKNTNGITELTTEEIKHFLSSETKLFKYNPDSLRMIHEIIDIADKDIKSIMTPRLNIIAMDENASMNDFKELILKKKVSKIPLYKDNLDDITGIVFTKKILPTLISGELDKLQLKEISHKPIFLSEYSSLNYALRQFKKKNLDMAIILDEYGSTIGLLTLNDIFQEILAEIHIRKSPIKSLGGKKFILKGNLPIEEVNSELNIHLPEKKDYKTISGLFIYYYGKFPTIKSKIKLNNLHLRVRRMGKRKIDEIELTIDG